MLTIFNINNSFVPLTNQIFPELNKKYCKGTWLLPFISYNIYGRYFDSFIKTCSEVNKFSLAKRFRVGHLHCMYTHATDVNIKCFLSVCSQFSCVWQQSKAFCILCYYKLFLFTLYNILFTATLSYWTKMAGTFDRSLQQYWKIFKCNKIPQIKKHHDVKVKPLFHVHTKCLLINWIIMHFRDTNYHILRG